MGVLFFFSLFPLLFFTHIDEIEYKNRIQGLLPNGVSTGRGVAFSLPVPGTVGRIFDHILESLYKWLNRRSQRKSYTWFGMKKMLRHYRFQVMKVRKPRVAVDWYHSGVCALHWQCIIEEPDAVIMHARICMGASQ